MKRLIYLILFYSSLCAAAPELKGGPEELKSFLHPDGKIISVSAYAEETAYCDKAKIHLVVSSEEASLSSAMQENQQVRDQVTKRLVDLGIDSHNINNAKFSSSPEYGWFGKQPTSFKVVNRISIDVSTESKLQGVAKIADQFEEVELAGVSFEHSRKDELALQVKKNAVNKILQQKAFYEQSLGLNLQPINLHENNAGMRASEGAGIVEKVVVYGDRKAKTSLSQGRGNYVKSSANSFEEVVYSANITIDFKVK